MSVTVEEGDSLSQVGQMLKDDGLIENEYVFIIQAYFYDYEILSRNLLSEYRPDLQGNAGGDERASCC